MEYNAVFWDVGGVILNIDSIARGQQSFVGTAVETYDLDVPVTEALDIWREAMSDHFAGRKGTEYRTARVARRKAANALFDGEPPADWRDLYERVRREHTTTNPGARETMRTLSEAGVYQAILSDADDGGLRSMLERFKLDEYIADLTTSEEVGYVKPDRRIFDTALEKARRTGIQPSRGIMIGDKYENDMEGGTAAGLTTVSFGAGEGPAVDYSIDELVELLDVVGVGRETN
ncbi:MAG: HAD family hydrolase [Natronomonas sp.]